MKTRILLGVSATLMLAAASSHSQDRGFYVGADIGQASADLDQRGLDNSLVAAFEQVGVAVFDGSSSTSEDDFTWGLLLGYQIFPFLAVEAAYVDMGSFEYKARGTLTDGSAVTDGTFRMRASGKGPIVSALGILPFADVWSVYGRVGVAFADVDYDLNLTVGSEGAASSPSSSSENFMWGVGVGYSGGQWTSRVEYQQITDVGDNDIAGKADASRITFGAIYHF